MKDRFTFYTTEINLNLRYNRLSNRTIDTNPFKILDAPGVLEKENLLDWHNNILGIALHESSYIYNSVTKNVTEVYSSPNYISSLKIHRNTLFSGDSTGKINVFDIKSNKVLNLLSFDTGSVNCIDCNENVMTFSGKNFVKSVDLRSNEVINSLKVNEVVKIKYSHDKKYLGMVGNGINIYNVNSNVPFFSTPLVSKSIDWCNWRNGIICSGGYKNNTLMIYDILDKKEEKSLRMNAQITNVKFINRTKEILVCTGKGSKENSNSISIYRANSLRLVSEFGKHDFPILNAELSHDEKIVCSVSCDESLKFWRIISEESKFKKDSVDFR